MTPEERAQCATVLRAVADLVEAGDATGDMDAKVTFWVTRTEDERAAIRTVVQGIPLKWDGASSPGSGRDRDWYDVTAGTDGAGHLNGVRLQIHAHADAVATEAGQRTVTIWQAAPEIAALFGDDPEVTA